VVDSDTEQVII